jgi:hypothetical protein
MGGRLAALALDRSKIEAGIRELNLGELRVIDADGKVLAGGAP